MENESGRVSAVEGIVSGRSGFEGMPFNDGEMIYFGGSSSDSLASIETKFLLNKDGISAVNAGYTFQVELLQQDDLLRAGSLLDQLLFLARVQPYAVATSALVDDHAVEVGLFHLFGLTTRALHASSPFRSVSWSA